MIMVGQDSSAEPGGPQSAWIPDSVYAFPPIHYLTLFLKMYAEIFTDRMVLIFLSFMMGMAAVLITEVVMFWRYFHNAPVMPPPKCTDTGIHLPEVLKNRLGQQSLKQKEECVWFNFLMQFLFSELRDSLQLRRFLTKKIQTEFEEVLRSRSGILVDELFLRDFHLGDKFPVITGVSVDNSEVSGDIIQTLDLKVRLAYDGGFQIAIDAALPFSRMAQVSVRVLKLQGLMRFRFTLLPYSHWSMSFCEEPELDLEVNAQLDGRPMPKLRNIIANQIRRIVRKRHTLPMYKIRYKPFFRPRNDAPKERDHHIQIDGEEIGSGVLEVTIIGASRLPFVPKGAKFYCTISVDKLPWKQLIIEERKRRGLINLDLMKNSSDQSLGMTVKDELLGDRMHPAVVIGEISVGSPAHMANVKEGDILVGVNGNKVLTAKQAMKNLKWAKDNKIQLQVERPGSESGSSAMSRDDMDFPRRVNSWHSASASEPRTSNSNTDSSSVKSFGSTSLPSGTPPLRPKFQNRKPGSNPSDSRRTMYREASENPKWGQKFIFTVDPTTSYLNICLWCKGGDRKGKSDILNSTKHDILLGYVSLTLEDIYLHCLLTLNGTMQDKVNLKHGHYNTDADLIKMWSVHKGWDPSQMYGDLSLGFHFCSTMLTPLQRQALTSCRGGSFKLQSELLQRFKADVVEGTDRSATTAKAAEEKGKDEGHHQFDSTTFMTATFCDYCGKKIWMKDAFKCKTCHMVCHKKCLVKCLVNTFCTESGVKKRDALDEPWEPLAGKARRTINVDGAERKAIAEEEDSTYQDLIEEQQVAVSDSVSLQNFSALMDTVYEPHRRGSTGRRADGSPELNPMTRFRVLKDQTERMRDSVMKHLKKNKPQAALTDSAIMQAKELGAQLFIDMDLTSRRHKLEDLVKKLDEQLKAEMDNKEAIEQEILFLETVEQKASNAKRRSELKTLQSKAIKSGEKQDAMRLLMLQYCSGLQNCINSLESEARAAKSQTQTGTENQGPSKENDVLRNSDEFKRSGSSTDSETQKSSKDSDVQKASLKKESDQKTEPVKTSRSAAVGGFVRRASSSVKEKVSSIKKDFGRKGSKAVEEKQIDDLKAEISLSNNNSRQLHPIDEDSGVQRNGEVVERQRREVRSKSVGQVEDLMRTADVETLKEVLQAPAEQIPLTSSHPAIEIRVDDVDLDVDANDGAVGGVDVSENASDPNEPSLLSKDEMPRSRSDSGLEITKMLSLSPEDILRYRSSSLPRLFPSDDSDSESDYLVIDSSDEPVVSDSDSDMDPGDVGFEGGLKKPDDGGDSDDGRDQHRSTVQQLQTFQV